MGLKAHQCRRLVQELFYHIADYSQGTIDQVLHKTDRVAHFCAECAAPLAALTECPSGQRPLPEGPGAATPKVRLGSVGSVLSPMAESAHKDVPMPCAIGCGDFYEVLGGGLPAGVLAHIDGPGALGISG